LEGGTLFISRNTEVFSLLKSSFEDCGFYDVTPISLKKEALALKLNQLKPKYVFMHSEFYSCVTPYMIGCLLKKFPELNISVVNFGHFHDGNAGHFIFHGANSYLDLNYGIDKFKEGLKIIKAGKVYYSPGVERQISDLDEKPDYKREITKREWNVLLLICNGHKNDGITANLGVKKRTVETHIHNLNKLFYANSRVDLSNKAAFMGWVRKEDLGIQDTEIKTPQHPSKKRNKKIPPAHGGGG